MIYELRRTANGERRTTTPPQRESTCSSKWRTFVAAAAVLDTRLLIVSAIHYLWHREASCCSGGQSQASFAPVNELAWMSLAELRLPPCAPSSLSGSGSGE